MQRLWKANWFREAGLWPPNQLVFDGEFDRIEALTAPYTDELKACQTPPPNGRGEENSSTSGALNEINVDNSDVSNVSTQPMPYNLSAANEIYVDSNIASKI